MEYYLKQQEEGISEPVSPTGQYMNSSVLSVSILCVMELEVMIDDLLALSLIKDVFLPVNSRFSSIMVEGMNRVKQWKRVEVKIEDHVIFPTFPNGLSLQSYEEYLDDYISEIAMEELPQGRPLWEIHMIKYPTSQAAGNIIFKLHHALGDGFSLMGALFSCLQRADNPSLPLTFPSFRVNSQLEVDSKGIFRVVPRLLSTVFNTILDFGWSFLKSSLMEDDRTPVRSGDVGVEFKPITISAITFSLDDIKMIKRKVGVTINDVITGIIFFGVRLYMQSMNDESSKARCTALVLLNTRMINGYKSIEDMMEPHSPSQWGNQFAFLHVSLPELAAPKSSNPLQFIAKAHNTIKRKRISLTPHLTARLLEALRKYRGPEAAAQYIYNIIKNTSLGISNLIGPTEQIAIANHPIGGLYFTIVGVPHSLSITSMSYMEKLRVSMAMEKGLIDPIKLKSCMDTAFHTIFKAAMEDSPPTKLPTPSSFMA